MAFHEFRAEIPIRASPEAAFDFVADHRHVAEVLGGVTRWRPRGRSTGLGARFDVEMRVFGLPLGGTLRIDSWERPHRIGWVSESGLIKQRGRWRFEKRADGVKVELTISYRPPAGIAGELMATGLGGRVTAQLQSALERIRERLEA